MGNVNGYESEGCQVTLKKLQDEPTTESIIQADYIPDLVLLGTYKEKDDTKLFEEVIRLGSKTKEKLFLIRMINALPAKKYRVFPLLKKLTVQNGRLENDAFLRFDKWCPDLTDVRFTTGARFSAAAYDQLISTDVIFPKIKTFVFEFGDYDEIGFDRDFLEAMDLKFPSLESLDLKLDNSDFSSHYEEYRVTYKPLYFKNLKKLSLFAFGEDVSKLLDYMSISNVKLKEFKFNGMTTPKRMVNWIGNCKRLGKLTLDCPWLDEWELMGLKNMRWLNEVLFEGKYLDWEPKEIIKFARNNSHLKKMTLTSDRKNNSMKFGKKFKNLFDELVQQRPKLTIKVHFFEGRREIKISAAGLTEKQEYETPDTEDEEEEGREKSDGIKDEESDQESNDLEGEEEESDDDDSDNSDEDDDDDDDTSEDEKMDCQ